MSTKSPGRCVVCNRWAAYLGFFVPYNPAMVKAMPRRVNPYMLCKKCFRRPNRMQAVEEALCGKYAENRN